MKKIVHTLSLLFLIISSCSHADLSIAPPSENLRNIGDFLKNNYDYNLFYESLNYVGLIEKLNSEGSYTVFVVPNSAFHKKGILTKNDILKLNKDSLLKALNNYILPMKLQSKDLPTNGVDVRYKTLSGNEISMASNINEGDKDITSWYVQGYFISYVQKNINLINGTIHELEYPFNFFPDLSIKDFLSNRPQYNNFVLGLKKFGIWDKLDNNSIYTIFAPTNEALKKIGITKDWLDKTDLNLYNGNRLFGTYILFNKQLFLSDFNYLSGRYKYLIKDDDHIVEVHAPTPFNGIYDVELWVTKPNKHLPIATSINNQASLSKNNRCSNGIIHQIDNGLVAPKDSQISN